MRRLVAVLVAVLAVLAVAISGCSSGTPTIADVDAQTFLQRAAEPGVTVIDVRTPEEFAAGHLQGAINMDVEGPGFSTQLEALDRSGTYAVYCHSGRRSSMAATAMAGAAFMSIVNLTGGIADLQAAGGQIVAGP